MSLLPRYKECFFCGPDGDGLKMKIQLKDGTVFSHFVVAPKFQGYDNMAHGGIVAGLLDEIMWWTIFVETRKISFTRKMETEYIAPVYCGAPYTVRGAFLGQRHGSMRVSAAIEDAEGKTVARATGLFMTARHVTSGSFSTKLDFSHVSREIKDMFLTATE